MLLIVLGLIAVHLKIFITARAIRNQVNQACLGQKVHKHLAEIRLAAITTGMFMIILISYSPYLIGRPLIEASKDVEVSHSVQQWLLLFITMSTLPKQFLLGILSSEVRSRIVRQWINFHNRTLTRQKFPVSVASTQF